MKIIKFINFKAKWILGRTKTAVMRLFDDKDIKEGDELELFDSDLEKVFAKAVISEVLFRKLEDVEDVDLDGHEKWNSKEEMLENLKIYYRDKISLDTPVKIVRFRLI